VRYIGIIIIIVIIVAAVLITIDVVAAIRAERRRSAMQSPDKLVKAGGEAVLQLDRILTDPTLIGSPTWRDEATKAVNDWHGRQ